MNKFIPNEQKLIELWFIKFSEESKKKHHFDYYLWIKWTKKAIAYDFCFPWRFYVIFDCFSQDFLVIPREFNTREEIHDFINYLTIT